MQTVFRCKILMYFCAVYSAFASIKIVNQAQYHTPDLYSVCQPLKSRGVRGDERGRVRDSLGCNWGKICSAFLPPGVTPSLGRNKKS